jgi:Zn-dependent M28 family amino/carboxypeptidase
MNRHLVLLTILFSTAALCCSATHAAGAMTEHDFKAAITAGDFAAHIRTLASDAFGGRGPATEGEEKTLRYLRDQFERMGLAPGNGDSYFQVVPVQARLVDMARSRIGFEIDGNAVPLTLGAQAVLGSGTARPDIAIADNPVVFVGFGIKAPDQNWDDYAGIDVKGKTVVLLAGEPDPIASERNLFDGRRWTHYSRLPYKFEEAARQGAVAAVIVHDTGNAGYDWEGVRERWLRPQFALPARQNEARLQLEGWISGGIARVLFARAHLDLDALRRAANQRGFKASPMGDARLSAVLEGRVITGESRNVIARLDGSRYPDEAVLYSAHWDHLGTQAKASGDNIFNGALDNASGVAALLEVAARFAAHEPRPERSIQFLVPTLEEQGLLGSKYYTEHPLMPLAKTVVDINFDMVVPIGCASDFIVIGLEYSDLDRVVEPIVGKRGRVLAGDRGKDSFFRSDHLSFAKAGVPVLYMRGGEKRVLLDRGSDLSERDWYRVTTTYHTPNDEFDSDWDMRCVAEDLDIFYEVGSALASGRDWPNYRPGSVYRAVRDASRASEDVGRLTNGAHERDEGD